jgi:hypothetical protein
MPLLLTQERGLMKYCFNQLLDTKALPQRICKNHEVSSSHIFGTLGIPATSGLAIGLVAGLAKS